LEFLDDDAARWFAKLQSMYAPLQAAGHTKTFGGTPGDVQPYGFVSFDPDGALYTVVNPAQSVQEIPLLKLSETAAENGEARLLFRDAGYPTALGAHAIRLGPGQMAMIGFGRYADPQFDLGIQQDVKIPLSIAQLPAEFHATDANTISATVGPPADEDLRIVLQQKDSKGTIRRSWPGGPPDGESVGKVLKLRARQNGKELAVETDYDRVVWSGLSWAVGEIRHGTFSTAEPITIECSSTEKEPLMLEGKLYAIQYAK
jgi:hypothetical protein